MGKCLRQQLLGFFSADLLPNNVEDGPRRENHQKLFFNFPIALRVYFTVVVLHCTLSQSRRCLHGLQEEGAMGAAAAKFLFFPPSWRFTSRQILFGFFSRQQCTYWQVLLGPPGQSCLVYVATYTLLTLGRYLLKTCMKILFEKIQVHSIIVNCGLKVNCKKVIL